MDGVSLFFPPETWYKDQPNHQFLSVIQLFFSVFFSSRESEGKRDACNFSLFSPFALRKIEASQSKGILKDVFGKMAMYRVRQK